MSIRNGKEAYKSPIETIWSDIEYDYVEQIEQMVLTAVQNVGIRVNKEELVKALAYDREQYRKGWEDRDSEIVRCLDCRYGYQFYDVQNGITDSWVECRNPNGLNRDTAEDGYCYRGERKDDNA